jgi:beta-glucosidase/6-phospho-beta-glucosidase/beta-galactosidase
MRPQLELMLAGPGGLPPSGLSGLGGGLYMPLTVAAGHLIWGAVLGSLYTHPVGYATGQPPTIPRRQRRAAGPVSKTPALADDRFMFATGIECSYPTLEHGRWRMDQMAACGHYEHWARDLELVRSLGLRYLRYGPPLHLIHQGPGKYDWAFLDEVASDMQRLDIVPVMDLCHFGVPAWLENFQNPEVPHALAEYAKAFARRYPSVRLYTPVNEMYVCSKLSALDGLWNEQCRDERAFVTAVRHLAKANVLMMQAIAAERPDAVFINSESGEFFQPCCPDPEIRRIADFENERRFLPLDLLYARPVGDVMRTYLADQGMPADEYAWFMQQDVRNRAILGVDYYEWNEKLIDSNGHAQTLGELFGWYAVAGQYYERYRRPLMHTETNRMDAREGPRWLWRQWHNVQLIRRSGVPVVGFTWYSLTDQVDWDIALREPLGNVNPVGLFDLNRDPRTVGQAYKHLVQMFERDLREDPAVEAVLGDAVRFSRERSIYHA